MIKLRKFKALVKETGLDDIGASGLTFECTSLEPGKIYTEQDTTYWDDRAKNSPPFFVDDNGCSRRISDMLYKKLVEEVFD